MALSGEDDDDTQENAKPDSEVECALLEALSEVSPNLPVSSANVGSLVTKKLMKNVSHEVVLNLLQKFVAQQLIRYILSYLKNMFDLYN